MNNRILLPVGKLDFYMSANSLQSFDAVAQNIPTLAVAAMFQKDPQVLMAHPDQGIDKFEDLKQLTLVCFQGGARKLFPVAEGRFRIQRGEGEALHVEPATVPRGQAQCHAGLRHV